MGGAQSNLQDGGSGICATVDYESPIQKVLASPIESKIDEFMLGSTAFKNCIVELSFSFKNGSFSDAFLGCVLNLLFPGNLVRKVLVSIASKFNSNALSNGTLYYTIAGKSSKILDFTKTKTANYDGLFIFDVSNIGDLAEVGSDYWSAVAADKELVTLSIIGQSSEFLLVPVRSYTNARIYISTKIGAKAGGPVCLGREAANNLSIVGICQTSNTGEDYKAVRFNLINWREVYSKLGYLSITSYVQSKYDNDLYLNLIKRDKSAINCW